MTSFLSGQQLLLSLYRINKYFAIDKCFIEKIDSLSRLQKPASQKALSQNSFLSKIEAAPLLLTAKC
jgi:hypothetical protein